MESYAEKSVELLILGNKADDQEHKVVSTEHAQVKLLTILKKIVLINIKKLFISMCLFLLFFSFISNKFSFKF